MQNEIKNYSITGMTCSACSARVEKVVSNIDGIQACSVNLLTNSMQVKGDVDSATIIEAVEKAGWFSLMLQGIGKFFSGLWDSTTDFVGGLF